MQLGTAQITSRQGLVTVTFTRMGSFLQGTQLFGDGNKGFNAALRFCRLNALAVTSCNIEG